MNFIDTFNEKMTESLQEEVNKIAEEEIERAKQNIERRIKQTVDKVALKVSNWYSISDRTDHLRIEVRKPDED